MSTTARIPGGKLRDRRLEREMTQRELAQQIGVDAITISRWERGEGIPNEINRVRLGRYFKVHPNTFLRDVA